MQSLAGIDVVEGSPRPSAELARALILRDGHTFTVHDATGSRVRVSGLRVGRPESERVVVEWTLDMARAAGLVNKTNWRSYPRAMLMARATGDLARILFPDVIKGLGYVAETNPEALEGWASEAPEAPEPMPPPVAPPAIQRKPRTGPAPASGESPHGPPELPAERPAGADPEGKPTSGEDIRRRALFAAIGKALGPNAQRAERLALCAAILGRPLESSTDMDVAEVGVCLDWLDAYQRGFVTWTYDAETETGEVGRRAEEPPEPEPVADTPLDPWAGP
jgi:hypothetical protein